MQPLPGDEEGSTAFYSITTFKQKLLNLLCIIIIIMWVMCVHERCLNMQPVPRNLRKSWSSTNNCTNTKTPIFNSKKQVMLYGSETWRPTKQTKHRLQTFINTCLRATLSIQTCGKEHVKTSQTYRKPATNPTGPETEPPQGKKRQGVKKYKGRNVREWAQLERAECNGGYSSTAYNAPTRSKGLDIDCSQSSHSHASRNPTIHIKCIIINSKAASKKSKVPAACRAEQSCLTSRSDSWSS